MYVPESPRWLFEKGRYKETKETLLYLTEQNGIDAEPLTDKQFAEEVIENDNLRSRISLSTRSDED